MMKIKPLSSKLLFKKFSLKELNFTTTEELEPLSEPLGQDRAMAAIELGIHIQQEGYNLYLLGPKGTGKHNLILSILKYAAKTMSTPTDWCYINNFDNPQKPLALSLPAGGAESLRNEIADIVERLQVVAQTEWSKIADKLIEELESKYESLPKVLKYLVAIKEDLQKHALDPHFVLNYQVNVLVSYEPDSGAPVIYEDYPNLANLSGCLKYVSQPIGLIAQFSHIHPGALHKANGGFLIMDAQQLMNQNQAWDFLKRALYAGKITLEPSDQTSSFPVTANLDPEPIPLQVKVILIGERNLYYSLCEQDTNFADLFKVAADFSNHIPRNSANFMVFSRFLATLIKKSGLLPLNRHAVAKMIDYSTRLANDIQRLSIHQGSLTDLLQEASYWAGQDNRRIVKAIDIQRAIEQKIYRSNRIETRIQEDFKRNIILIETKGKKIGQINGLSVLQIGHYSFGSPGRITATVRLGKGELVDIEREVELGGALHSKGVFILSGFINGKYLTDHHLSISASLVFEQNYGEVEGDSASAAELAALLSAIGKIPVKQSLAITGSINQHGQIQAIGNLNEKIEGFFAICQTKGLTGQQGVIIPASNVQHLMLKDEVVEAVRKKVFSVYSVETIDQVMTLLTGLPAGKANKKGRFPENTVNGLVEASLLRYAQRAEGDHKSETEEK